MKDNATKAGAVITFKDGVTKKQAEEALKAIRDLCDYPPRVNLFDPRWGGPVWYIP